MSERCQSMANSSKDMSHFTDDDDDKPYGAQQPTYFYLDQKKPTPMEPLKVWRGYHGNVYFEPIQIGQARIANSVASSNCESRVSSSQGQAVFSNVETLRIRSRNNLSRGSQSGIKSGTTRPFSYKGPRHMSLLDKKTVLKQENVRLHEDLTWIQGSESIGSLCVKADQNSSPANRRAATCKLPANQNISHGNQNFRREKICRGSVAKKFQSSNNGRLPMLTVMGDKYSHPQFPSPLLRAQTQYSQSSQRMAVNSPESSYHGYVNYDNKLPPLEQLRASLKHMERVPTPESNVFHPLPGQAEKNGEEYSTAVQQSSLAFNTISSSDDGQTREISTPTHNVVIRCHVK